jgi:YD repeat-containing protein
VTVNKTNGSHVTTLSDGSVTTVTDGPDPRFSMQVSITTNTIYTTGGLTSTTSAQRTVNLTDPHNVLSLTALTDTVTVNGHTSTRSYNAATKTFTNTSPINRTSTATIDNLGRVTQAKPGSLSVISTVYDAQGRPSSITQGTGIDARIMGFGYNPQGYLSTVTDPLGRQMNYTYDAAGRVIQQSLPDNRLID